MRVRNRKKIERKNRRIGCNARPPHTAGPPCASPSLQTGDALSFEWNVMVIRGKIGLYL